MASSDHHIASVRSAEGHHSALHWLWLGTAFAIAFAPVLVSMAGSWSDPTANMEHGMLVPFVIAFAVHQQREALSRIETQGTWWGLALLLLAVLQVWIATLAQWVFLARLGVLEAAVGCLLYWKGLRYTKALAYPLGISLLMIAPPTFLYTRLMFQLQLLASVLAEHALELLGFSVLREGNILELVGEKLAVEEACSGIKSLLTLAFFALVYVYFLVQKRSLRLALLLSVIPIAISGNALRIVITGVVGQYDRQLAHSVFHDISGYVILCFAGLAFLSVHGLHNLLTRRRTA